MTRKTVFCIRHGESTFNAAYRATGVDPLHLDAPLSEEGHRQVREARDRLRHIPFELVVTSPLTRALQTTAGLFAEHPARPRILVEALHRELAESSCDVGRPKAVLVQEFPHFDLDHLPDIWWHAAGEPDERGICIEPHDSLQARIADFRMWLARRPERTIGVVGHHTFFFHFTGARLHNCQAVKLAVAPSGEFDVEPHEA
jgi:broad specificity phosphatase PhoE